MAKKIRGRNEGSLHRRPNGSWRAQISLDGKRISFGAKTKPECQQWLRKMQFELDRGYDFLGGKILLSEFLRQWLDASTASLRPKTAQQYEQVINKHINPLIGNIQLKELRLSRIEKFYGELIQSGVGIRMVRITHSILHRALERAVHYGVILRNPAHKATLPRYTHAEMQVLDEGQVSQFLVAAQDSRFEALYQLAVTTGLRQGEILGLMWTDLHWITGILHVSRQVQVVRGQGWSFVEPKTRSGRRTVQVGENTLQALRRHRERQEQLKALAGESWQEHGLIFTSRIGTPLDPSNLRLDFYRVLELARLPKIRFHDLRHTAASLMLNHGVPVIVASKMLGHSKPSITLDIYGHLYHEMQGEAARIMDELVSPIRVELDKPAQTSLRA